MKGLIVAKDFFFYLIMGILLLYATIILLKKHEISLNICDLLILLCFIWCIIQVIVLPEIKFSSLFIPALLISLYYIIQCYINTH